MTSHCACSRTLLICAIDVDEKRVARGARDQEVELRIPLRELVLVVVAILEPRQHSLHLVEIAARGVQHREPRRVGLDGEARLDQLQRADEVGVVVRRRLLRVRRGDEGAAAESSRNQSGLLELIERAADGAARGAKGDRQLPLRRKLIAFAVGCRSRWRASDARGSRRPRAPAAGASSSPSAGARSAAVHGQSVLSGRELGQSAGPNRTYWFAIGLYLCPHTLRKDDSQASRTRPRRQFREWRHRKAPNMQ